MLLVALLTYVASLALKLAIWTCVLSIPYAESMSLSYKDQAPHPRKMQQILERETPLLWVDVPSDRVQ